MDNERLELLRDLMRDRNIDIYVVPTADFHESEYVGDYFKARQYLTGFTGSAGVAVITLNKAGLWTDGRYFIQAEKQLRGSGFDLYKMAAPGVPTVNEFIDDELPQEGCIGFDGRVINAAWGREMAAIAEKKNGTMIVTEDLVDRVWPDRPERAHSKAWILGDEYTGESAASKLSRVREVMSFKQADCLVLTTLDDICWLLNIRGRDVEHVPVVLSYLILTQKACIFYANAGAVTQEVKEYLRKNQIQTAHYNDIYKMADYMGEKSVGSVMLDSHKVNYRIYRALAKSNRIVDMPNPSVKMKAVKNPVEIENIKKAHIKDGVAMVKWIIWLKQQVGYTPVNEVSAQEKLAAFRAEQDGFLDLSFGTICAYRANAAMMHYSARHDTCAVLKPEGFLLCDSGGHYMEGSTDITRTIVLGPVNRKERALFTAVLRCNLNLRDAKFLYGCTGQNLDILARGPLWSMGLDYRCGTGHGVGYLLNIHEAPNGFRWRSVSGKNESAVLEEGMITTDEPGVYLEGELGIRTEDELLCRRDIENEYGQFMSFEDITYCPIDLDAVDPDEMTKHEKLILNRYHANVYLTLAKYLSDEEKNWLRHATREI